MYKIGNQFPYYSICGSHLNMYVCMYVHTYMYLEKCHQCQYSLAYKARDVYSRVHIQNYRFHFTALVGAF